MDRFWWYLAEIFKSLWNRVCLFSFHVGLLVITLSSLNLHTENNACMVCASVSCWARLFLQQLETQFFVNNPRNWWSMDSRLTWNFSNCSVALRFVFLTQQLRLNCVNVIISTRSASAAARTTVDCSELHQQPVDAVLHPTFVQKLCYKLSSVVTITFIQIFDRKFVAAFAWYSVKIRVIFGVRFERRKVDKKANLHENWNMQPLF